MMNGKELRNLLKRLSVRYSVLLRAFPPDRPRLALTRFENLLKAYLAWKYGLNFKDLEPCMIQIEHVRGCNVKCIMCNGGDFPKRFLSFDRFKDILELFPKSFMLALYYWGEPFLSRETLRMAKYAALEKRMLVKISSNLTVMPNPEEIVRSGIYHIKVSVDTFDEEKFSRIRRGADLRKVLSNLEALIRAKKNIKGALPVISINTVVMDENVDDLEDIVKKAIELEVDSVEFLRFLGIPGRRDHHYTNPKIPEILTHIQKRYSDEIEIQIHNFESIGTYHDGGFCHYAYFSSVIDIDGNVFCQFFVMDPAFRAHINGFGNIFSSSMRDILAKRNAFIRGFREGVPSRCGFCPLASRRPKT